MPTDQSTTSGELATHNRVRLLPNAERRRIQIIGFTATGAATAVWVVGFLWLSLAT